MVVAKVNQDLDSMGQRFHGVCPLLHVFFATAATMKWTRDTEGGGAVAALGRNGVIAEPGAARFFATAKNGPEKKHSAYRKKISFALYLRHEHF